MEFSLGGPRNTRTALKRRLMLDTGCKQDTSSDEWYLGGIRLVGRSVGRSVRCPLFGSAQNF